MNKRKTTAVAAALFCCLFLVGANLIAPTKLAVDRLVIGGGGGHAEAAAYALDSTMGQAVTGVHSHGPYALCAGFWCAARAEPYRIYLPLVLRVDAQEYVRLRLF
jgi:hypothetical protein